MNKKVLKLIKRMKITKRRTNVKTCLNPKCTKGHENLINCCGYLYEKKFPRMTAVYFYITFCSVSFHQHPPISCLFFFDSPLALQLVQLFYVGGATQQHSRPGQQVVRCVRWRIIQRLRQKDDVRPVPRAVEWKQLIMQTQLSYFTHILFYHPQPLNELLER